MIPTDLLAKAASVPYSVLGVNGHIHTPYSFSAFSDVKEAFEMARQEHVDVLGINDFYVTDGYDEFHRLAVEYKIYPLFNVEFIALDKALQAAGIRINDPGNPGRIYFSGKGLAYPQRLTAAGGARLASLMEGTQEQVREMIAKTNGWLADAGLPLQLDYEAVKSRYARELVRERHIAKALRIAISETFSTESSRIGAFTRLYGGVAPAVDMHCDADLENEIRARLLKAGGKAFVPEEESAFLSLEEAMAMISKAGGIPCYPVLLDDKNGKCTEFEGDAQTLSRELLMRGIFAIELIPGRNALGALEPFVEHFVREGFVITLGTEHNAPDMIPVLCDARGNQPLTNFLKQVNYEGACVTAAHQYLMSMGLPGYLDDSGRAMQSAKADFVTLGNAVIRQFTQGITL